MKNIVRVVRVVFKKRNLSKSVIICVLYSARQQNLTQKTLNTQSFFLCIQCIQCANLCHSELPPLQGGLRGQTSSQAHRNGGPGWVVSLWHVRL